MRRTFLVLLASGISLAPASVLSKPAPNNQAHVVLVVWDGMRPDFVTEKGTPALWKLAREGVTFHHHHSVYPTSTNTNGAIFATGVQPNRSGLLANNEYRPLINPLKAVDTGELDTIVEGDATSGGNYLPVPTIAEVVRAAGGRTAVTGAKSVALLLDRQAEWTRVATKKPATIFVAAPMPAAMREQTEHLLGPFLVEDRKSNAERSAFAAHAMTEVLWRAGIPEFSAVWLGDPDLSQHDTWPGSALALSAIQNCDRDLASILDALTRKNARDTTDVLVVSDHGFSTVERTVDLVAQLREAEFDAMTAFKQPPRPGQVLVVGLGGTELFYVIEHDPAVIARVTDWLQQADSTAVVFTRAPHEGTFLLQTINANTANAPDVMVALRWSARPNQAGVPGAIVADSSRTAAKGSHASIGSFDMHNTLIAAGPHFRHGAVDDAPTGNIDLVATMLHILGIPSAQKLDGRVLREAMTGGDSGSPEVLTETVEASRSFPAGEWHQRLRLSRVGESTYLDEGDGGFVPK